MRNVYVDANNKTVSSTLTIPPENLQLFVGGAFEIVGKACLSYIQIRGLKPNERVLEVGCGCGRIAVPMTRFLDSKGHYEGFDISKECINWCKNNISPKYPNFHFSYVDIFNKTYNPSGRLSASSFAFPYDNETFDFVFLASVFTHMLQDDIMNYLKNIYRVLRNGGRCLATFFLFNELNPDNTQSNRSGLDFKYQFGEQKIAFQKQPEQAICYEEQTVRNMFEQCGLTIAGPIRFDMQDIIFAVK